MQRYYRETTGELRKVNWPTRREATRLTQVVILVMVVFAIFLGGLDYLFLQFFAWLFSTG
ncbi:MAG: preprotein translocase subunit SecE [Anaerolineae bacterium]|nr:MAG: preprotein translocase subunit SecE [Anaerolineae bacterium]